MGLKRARSGSIALAGREISGLEPHQISKLGVGYVPETDLLTGVGRYLEWIRGQGDVKDYFTEAAQGLKAKGIVHKATAR